MAGSDQLFVASINYYSRECLYRHVQTVVLEAIKKYGSDPVLLFWKSFGLIMEDNLPEGMRELENLLDKRDLVVCAPLLLVHAHKKCKIVDRDAVKSLESQVRTQRQSCGEKALYYAAMVLWHIGRNDKAREYVDKVLKIAPGSVDGLLLRAWIDLTSAKENYSKKANKFFEEVLNKTDHPKPIEALLGRARYLMDRHAFSGALDSLNEAIVTYQSFLPAFLEKMKVQVAMRDWEQAVETAQRSLILDMTCLEAHKTLVLNLLANEGRVSESAPKIGELIHLVDRFEPKNHSLYYNIALPFARLSCGNLMVLHQTGTLIERAQSLQPRSSAYVTEEAYQLLLRGDVKESLVAYKKAFTMDETSVDALAGIIHCQILEGQLDEAEQQLEFLNEVRSSLGKIPELLYLGALLASSQRKPSEEIVALVDEAAQLHFDNLKTFPVGAPFFHRLNPAFVFQMTQLLLLQVPVEPIRQGELLPSVLSKSTALLEPLSATAPGIPDTFLILARIRFLSGEMESAQSLLQQCLEHTPGLTEAHLLMAQVHLHKGSYKRCLQVLELGLSHNFEIQTYPMYHLVKGKCEKVQEAYTAALESFRSALKIISGSHTGHQRVSSSSLAASSLGLSHKASIYLELAEVNLLLNRSEEAAKVIKDAVKEFLGTSEEIRVKVASADIELKYGDVDKALNILKKVTPDQVHFSEARKKMADIYLNHRKDRHHYIACYKEIAQYRDGPQAAIMLGDAYMNIQEPESAIDVYETALKKNPRDQVLSCKTGQALVKAHYYMKAVNYYEASLKNSSEDQPQLRMELAELYLRLKMFDKAERTLRGGLNRSDVHMVGSEDLGHLAQNTRYWMLLAKVYQKAGVEVVKVANALESARENQSKVLKRVGVESPDTAQSEKTLAADVCCELASVSVEDQNKDEGIKLYKEALSHDEGHKKARIQLARLYLDVGTLDASEHECLVMLQSDPAHEEASIVLSEVAFQKRDWNAAVQHLKNLLDKRRVHFEGLVKLVDMSRRAGVISIATHYLEEAEKVCNRPAYSAGLDYCKGLLQWYMNDPVTALYHFNRVRRDGEWGEKALFNMVKICLNPDDDCLGSETFKSEIDTVSASEKQEAEKMAVFTAERLLKEIRPKTHQAMLLYKVLEGYIAIVSSSKTKGGAERALAIFTEIASAEKDHIPSLVGLATAQAILKQTPKARNTLKRIVKLRWTFSDADDFERSWLLLADIFIQGTKYDLAMEQLRRCLQHNQSCHKAWEYMGYIAEKEQNFTEAAERYEKAWMHCQQRNPNIGYRLAFIYLKIQSYSKSMMVCHKVLQDYPHYPKIQREILDKARSLLKT